MALNKVEICGLDTSKLPLMTQKRSRELLFKIKDGDAVARDTFIQENLRLVLSVIQRFSGRSEHMDDLFQVGCIGLIKAIDNFDLGHNVRFSTYAVPMSMLLGKRERKPQHDPKTGHSAGIAVFGRVTGTGRKSLQGKI